MTAIVTEVLDIGNDKLLVKGTVNKIVDSDGKLMPLKADGWVSAMTHYFPPDQYGPDGNLKSTAIARAMTRSEQLAYCKRLLEQQNPISVPSGLRLDIAG